MRLATVRTDMGPFFVADIESRSQRCFSSEPPGQTRYFEKASDAALTDVLNTYGKLTIKSGTIVFPLTIGAAQDTLTIADVSGAPKTFNIANATYANIASLVAAVNTAFSAQELRLVARNVGNALYIDTSGTNIGLSAYVKADASQFVTAISLDTSAFSGTTMLTALKAIIYPSASTVALQNGDIDGVLTFADLSTADLATLCDAVRDAAAPELVETGPVLLSYVYGQISKFAGATFQPGGDRAGYPAGAAFVVLADDGSAFTL